MAGKYGQKPSTASKKATVTPETIADEATPLNHVENQILTWFQTVRFRKITFGGLDEDDLWKKMSDLYDLFHQAISAERARYEGQLQSYAKSTTEKVNSLEAENESLRQQLGELYQAYLTQQEALRRMQGGE